MKAAQIFFEMLKIVRQALDDLRLEVLETQQYNEDVERRLALAEDQLEVRAFLLDCALELQLLGLGKDWGISERKQNGVCTA